MLKDEHTIANNANRSQDYSSKSLVCKPRLTNYVC